MSLLAFFLSYLRFSHHYWSFNPPSCCFSPFHLSYVAISRPCDLLEFYWGRGALGLIFAGYVPLASQSPYPIIVYSMANLSHFSANVIFMYLPYQSTFLPQKSKNAPPHPSKSIENATPL